MTKRASFARATALCFALAGISSLAPERAVAAESLSGVYLLGFRGPLAGILPPPGFYFENDYYQYDGKLRAGRSFSTGGFSGVGLKSQLRVDVLTPIWITPWEIFGGKLGFSALIPIGHANVSVGSLLTGPAGRTFGFKLRDSTTNFGDPFVSAILGWNAGNFHWSTTVGVNIPAGAYQEGQLANIALNRPALDVSGALTWLDPKIGLEISVTPGITFNWTNTTTNYKTGNEFHVEWGVSQYLSENFSVGVVGYHYQQLTGDSGQGATLGDLKGRVTALGGTVGYNFKVGDVPVSARVKIYKEFAAKNRQEGTAGFFTLSFPIGGQAPAPTPKPAVYKH